MPDIPNNGTSVQTIHEWLDWLQDSNTIKFFLTFLKLLQVTVVNAGSQK